MTLFRASIPPDVAEVIRHLPPDLKRSIKAAVRALAENPHLGEPLVKELAGVWKYRVKRFRIVYSINAKRKEVRLLAVGHRRTIYEDVAGQLRVQDLERRHRDGYRKKPVKRREVSVWEREQAWGT